MLLRTSALTDFNVKTCSVKYLFHNSTINIASCNLLYACEIEKRILGLFRPHQSRLVVHIFAFSLVRSLLALHGLWTCGQLLPLNCGTLSGERFPASRQFETHIRASHGPQLHLNRFGNVLPLSMLGYDCVYFSSTSVAELGDQRPPLYVAARIEELVH